MNINEIYDNISKNESFKFIEKETINYICPKCGNNLLKNSLISNKIEQECSQKYLYDDGDIINISKEYSLKADAEMTIGSCQNCNQKISSIQVILLDKDLDKNYLAKEFSDIFIVYSKNDMISNYKDLKQYCISINNVVVGDVIIYKQAVINKNSVYGLLKKYRKKYSIYILGMFVK